MEVKVTLVLELSTEVEGRVLAAVDVHQLIGEARAHGEVVQVEITEEKE